MPISKNLKERKKELQADPLLSDQRYIGLPAEVRQAFQRYMGINPGSSLTEFLAKRKIISDKEIVKNKENGGAIVREFDETGTVVSMLYKNGKVAE